VTQGTSGSTEASDRSDEVIALVVGRIAPIPVPRAEPSHELINDLGYSSLVLVQLVVVLEDLFDLQWTGPEDMVPITTVADLQRYVWEKIQAGLGAVPYGDRTDDVVASL
jgi:acyl carrier protein